MTTPASAPATMTAPATRFADFAARLALGWLVFGCTLGVVCAAGLLLPDLGLPALAGYGRLLVAHLDGQLYGWSFLPMLALAAAWLHGADHPRRNHAALLLWSAALAAGMLHWFRGGAAGKVFLDWRGFSLAALIAALVLIWLDGLRSALDRRATPGNAARWLVLVGLAGAGAGFVRACDPAFLPPVNPRSGGATGHNLLASTLGFAALVAVAVATLFPAHRTAPARRAALALALGGATLAHLAIRHGDVSNHETDQILGLAVTVLLGAGLAYWMSAFPWRFRDAFRWFAFWWLVTALDGLALFLPGALDDAKFSNALVAHAHWAMAGMLTALNLLILENLPGARVRFGAASQTLWHAANAAMGLALTLHATRESAGVLWRAHDGWTVAAYAARLAAGTVMLGVAATWLVHACGETLPGLARRLRAEWPAALLAAFGLGDAATGVFLATMPNATLAWMGVPEAAAAPPGVTGLVGVFVGMVGASYLGQAWLWRRCAVSPAPGTPGFAAAAGALRALFFFSAALRYAVAVYGFAAVADGSLGVAWLTVPVTDAVVATLQLALRRRIFAFDHA